MRVLFLFIISFNLFAGEITCENGGCTPNVDNLGLSLGEGLTESYISIEGNDNDLIIKANEKTSPRNIKLHLNKNLGSNLNIDLSSSKENNDGADTMIFADHIGNLSLINNGKNGVDSLASSVLCAQKILNGDMGEDVKNNFLNLRANDSSIPEDRCVAKDFDYVKNTKYACQEGFPELSEPKITTTRWLKKKRCSGGAERKMCVEKKVRIKCKWLAAYVDGCGKTPPPNFSDVVWKYDSSLCKDGNSGFYADRGTFIKSEAWYKEQKLKGYSDQKICNDVTNRLGKLNSSYRGSFVSKIEGGSYNKQETVTSNSDGSYYYLNMYYGRWYGHTSRGRTVNPDTIIPSGMKLARYLSHRGCVGSGSKYSSHLKNYMLDRSCLWSKGSYGVSDGGSWTTNYGRIYSDISYRKWGSGHYGRDSRGNFQVNSSWFKNEYYGNPSAVKCWQSGSTVPCRFGWLRPNDIWSGFGGGCDDWDCWDGAPGFSSNNGTSMGEASSASWQVKFEVLTPVGIKMQIIQKRGEGNY